MGSLFDPEAQLDADSARGRDAFPWDPIRDPKVTAVTAIGEVAVDKVVADKVAVDKVAVDKVAEKKRQTI